MLRCHRAYIHKRVKPRFHCDDCGKPSLLKMHIKAAHEGVRYHCDQCDYKATFKVNLSIHKETVHEDLRYPCDQCAYKTVRPEWRFLVAVGML